MITLLLKSKNRNTAIAWAILCLSCLSAWSQAQTKVLQVKGQTLVDSTGTDIRLIGTNLGNWLVPEGYMFNLGEVNAPRLIDELFRELVGPTETDEFWRSYLDRYITKADIVYLKSIGANHIRLPFHYQLFTDNPYMGTVNAGFTYLDRAVEWCRQEGLYVLLDMHCAPGGQTGDNIDDSYGYPYLLTDKAEQDEFVRIWTEIAKHYSGDPVIAGYDLANEPIAHYFKADQPTLDAALARLHNRTIDAIREVDADHAIWLNGSIWSTSFDVFALAPMRTNVVYEFHRYWMPPVEDQIANHIEFRDSLDVPIYLGESGENTNGWIDSFRLVLDHQDIGYAFWPYKKMRPDRCIRSIPQPASWGVISAYAKTNRRSYKDIRKDRPSREEARLALKEYLEVLAFERTEVKGGYVRALGFRE